MTEENQAEEPVYMYAVLGKIAGVWSQLSDHSLEVDALRQMDIFKTRGYAEEDLKISRTQI